MEETSDKKVVIFATSELMARFVRTLVEQEKKLDEVFAINCRPGIMNIVPSFKGFYLGRDQKFHDAGDYHYIFAFDSQNPSDDIDISRQLTSYMADIEYVVFNPGFEPIFNNDQELMKQYILGERVVPLKYVSQGEIKVQLF